MSLSNPHPGIPASSADLEILRAFEPIVRYTKGEKFYPMAVEPYVEASSLWLYVADGADEELVAEGNLSLDGLVEPRDAPFRSLFYLRFVHPLDLGESTHALAEERQLAKREQNEFHAGVGRLARGGLLPRLGDGLFSLSLLLRGNVPGATAAAAVLKYAQIREQDGRFVYQGRVARQSGWTICQYWFFFAYNPWRSGFHGVNDHESDWEMVSVYLYEDDGRLRPEWVAYASHDFHGADLRRRWDDPVDLELQDGHPVVYAGAGSHASYFKQGEYQAEVPIPSPRQFKRAAETIGRLWRTTLGQGDDRSPCGSRSSTSPAATGSPSARVSPTRGRRTSSTRQPPGPRDTAGCGGSMLRTRSPARTRRQARCTNGTVRRARRGSIRSASRGSTAFHRRQRRSRPSRPNLHGSRAASKTWLA